MNKTIMPVTSTELNFNSVKGVLHQSKVRNDVQKQRKKKKSLSQRVAGVTDNLVSKKGYVSPIDLLMGLGWLSTEKLTDWKLGRVSFLEHVITANLGKLTKTMKEFRAWAAHSKLKPSLTVYKHKSHRLHFSKSGNPNIEKAYSTHYLLPKPKKREI